MRWLALVLVTCLGACEDDGANWSTFRIGVAGNGTDSGPDGEVVQLNNSLDDPRGLAGLEIEVFGVGTHSTYRAADFDSARSSRPVGVPVSGKAHFVATLLDADRNVVAQTVGSWVLEPRVEWVLGVTRAVLDTSRGYGGPENPECGPFGCHQVWGDSIRGDARNYPSEVFWATLFRYGRDDCKGNVICDE